MSSVYRESGATRPHRKFSDSSRKSSPPLLPCNILTITNCFSSKHNILFLILLWYKNDQCSKTCQTRHLCNMFLCYPTLFFIPVWPFSMCILIQNFSPSACPISQILLVMFCKHVWHCFTLAPIWSLGHFLFTCNSCPLFKSCIYPWRSTEFRMELRNVGLYSFTIINTFYFIISILGYPLTLIIHVCLTLSIYLCTYNMTDCGGGTVGQSIRLAWGRWVFESQQRQT